jgi:mRNA interferase RelE/StbE
VYEIKIERGAEKEMRRLPSPMFQRVAAAVLALKNSPRPRGAKKLTGSANDWRIRAGEYRVIYEIDDVAQRVRVWRVGHRREVYR